MIKNEGVLRKLLKNQKMSLILPILLKNYDYYKLDPDNKMEEYRFGIIYIDGDDEYRVENIEPYFNAIPDDSETTITYKKDEPVEIVVKPVKFSEDDT